MTWSIVARDAATGAFGIAVATRFFAVGALCPWIAGGVGAVATQALINPPYGPRGLRLLREGLAPDLVLQALLAEDAGREVRQVHLRDARGRWAVHTGSGCVDWAGHAVGDGFTVAGNMLAGPQVVERTAAALAEADPALPFGERMIRALDAGEAAGGDKRGRQSAALRIHTTEEHPALDIRVDDHAEPLAELRRLYAVAQERFLPFSGFLPTAADPTGTTDRDAIEAGIPAARAALRL